MLKTGSISPKACLGTGLRLHYQGQQKMQCNFPTGLCRLSAACTVRIESSVSKGISLRFTNKITLYEKIIIPVTHL